MGTYTNLDDLVNPDIILDPILARAEEAQNYANTVITMSTDAIQELTAYGTSALDQDIFDIVPDDLFTIDSSGISGLNITDPVHQDVTIPTIADPATVIPAIPEMDDTDIDSIIGEVPLFTAECLPINLPDAPNDEFPVFTDADPTISDVITPSAPEYILPTAPILGEVIIPDPPDYEVISFEGVLPVADLTPPEAMFVYNEAEYSSVLKDQLSAKLYADLVTGGTGLDADTEQAIYDRAESRQQEADEQAMLEAQNLWASRGFSLPTGVLNGTMIEVTDRINRRKDDLNNDILVQQSKLAQENTHFIITQAIQLEKNLMDNANQVQNRAFEVAKVTVELAAVLYDIKVKHYSLLLEGYKVQAQVYEIRIRGEVAKAELYKARIEGVKAVVAVKELMVQAYSAQIEGIKSMVQLYGTQMEASKIAADIERLKLDSFKTKAEVFATKTEALTARYNAYQSQLAGEKIKADIYLTDAQAYQAKVSGFKAASDVELTKAQTKLAKYEGDIAAYKAIVDTYVAESNRLMAKAEVQIKAEGLKVENYKGEVQKYQVDIDALVKEYLGRVDAAKAEGDVLVKELEVAIQKLLGEKGLTSDAIIAQAKIASQLAAAALTSISASTSLGLSQTQGTSKSTSESSSSSHTNSYSESHNHMYQH